MNYRPFIFLTFVLCFASRSLAQELVVPDSLPQIQIDVDSLSARPLELSARRLERIDSLAEAGLRMGAYPGCQIFALHEGQVIYDRAFGSMTKLGGKGEDPTNIYTLYDLASVTKAVATTPA